MKLKEKGVDWLARELDAAWHEIEKLKQTETADLARLRAEAELWEATSRKHCEEAVRVEGENLELQRKNDALQGALVDSRAEVGLERMRLAACGVAAQSNLPDRLNRITPDNPYYSASYADVCHAVDREIALRAEVERLEKDVKEARDFAIALHKQSRVVTCVYCGQAYPQDTPAHGAGVSVLTEHIKTCSKHPMRELEQQLAQLRELAKGILAGDSHERLVFQAKKAFSAQPAPEKPAEPAGGK